MALQRIIKDVAAKLLVGSVCCRYSISYSPALLLSMLRQELDQMGLARITLVQRAPNAFDRFRRRGQPGIDRIFVRASGSQDPVAKHAASDGPRVLELQPDPGWEAVTSGLLDLINRERLSMRLAPLRENARLARAAVRHTADLEASRVLTHTGSDGSTPASRVRDAAYQYALAGENIIFGATDAELILRAWMESPNHRNNLFAAGFTECGFSTGYNAIHAPIVTMVMGGGPRVSAEKRIYRLYRMLRRQVGVL